MNNKNFEDLIKMMDKKIPSSKEYVNNLPNKMAREILARRLKLGLTQSQLAKLVQEVTGKAMHQSTISEVEGGTAILTTETYDRVLRALGMLDLEITFEDNIHISSAQRNMM